MVKWLEEQIKEIEEEVGRLQARKRILVLNVQAIKLELVSRQVIYRY